MPQELPRFSPDLASRLQPHLLACDLGVADACRDLGLKLEGARRLREAVAAYDHGCHLGSRGRAAEADRCHQYVGGQSCHPNACVGCTEATRTKPECRRVDPVICAERDRFCRYDTLENCLDLVQAQLCARAAFVYYEQMPAATAAEGGCATPEWFARAHAYATAACDRAAKNPAAKKTGDGESSCKDLAALRERAQKCARPLTTADARQMTEVRSSFQAYVERLGGPFAAGAAPTPQAPALYVNPATSATWTSANLAFIASLFPGAVQAPSPPAKVESIFGQGVNEGGDVAKPEPPPPPPPSPPPPPPPQKKK